MSIICYDSDGKLLKRLYQWDTDQTMHITGITNSAVPVFHFCNRFSKAALVVTPTVNGDIVEVPIPNILLQQPETIFVYLYETDQDASGRTMHTISIPVTPRPKPSDYEYIDNIEYPSYALLSARLSNFIATVAEDTGDFTEVADIRIGYDGTMYLTAGDAVRAIGEEVSQMRGELQMYIDAHAVDGLLYQDNLLYLTSGGEIVGNGVEIISGGGGGGGGSLSYTVTLKNLLESRAITIAEGAKLELKFNYSSVDADGEDDGAGVGKILINNVSKHTFNAVQGENTVDITPYISTGTTTVRVRVENSEGSTKTLNYTVTVAAARMVSSFDASAPFSGEIVFPYIPTGIAEKTVHFEMDGEEVGTEVITTSGRQARYTFPAQSHGAHTIRAWFTCSIDGVDVKSNVLYYGIMCTETGNNTPIIALTTPPVEAAEQFTNIVRKYRVYKPDSLSAAITLEANGENAGYLTVDRTEQVWTYRPVDVGTLTQTIRCDDVAVSWSVEVAESSMKVEAETDALALYLSAYGRSNNEEMPAVWKSGNIECEFENFNFVSDGWLQDEKENSVLRVTGDARLSIPYQMFASDFRTTGKTIEFEMATRDVLNYDATVVSCSSGNRGFTITAQQLHLASEQSYIGTRYKEDEHLRVTFVVEKKAENRLLLCYINGIMSGAVQYPEDDDFSQAVPVGITVGSNDCTTDLYCIRVYDNDLTRHQVLDNWIADTQDGEERLARFKRNAVYDDYGRVVISQLPNDLCYLVIQADELPQFKGDKKVCSGYFVDLVHPERSFTFKNAEIDVQGTSSQYYYRKNYKIKFKGGFILSDGTTATVYAMNDDAVPVDTFTMKADVASSEGAFNVVLSMLYNDLCPFTTPAQEEDPRVRQCIEGFPMVIFWAKDNEMQFLGKYNFNNDKGTEEVFGFQSGDESWEILQNGTDRVGWHSADFTGTSWKTDFEARYPEDNADVTRLQQLAEWLVSTDTEQATGNAIEPVTIDGVEYVADTAEYRLAKFSAELSDHFIEEAIIFYYLFTEVFLSIDQREKNAFPTYIEALDRWIVLFYDADSSCGTDNKGNLAFDYYLEDIDYTEGGDPVYNGQNSVLWKNLRQARYAEISAMYQDLRTSGQLSYDAVIGRFTDHQSKWPEAIFNEDMYVKCIEALILYGDGLYLPMLQGKKEHWIKWWLYNRFRYMDSKHVTGTSMTNRITIRAHQKANIFLTSYVNMYGHVYFNAADVYQRMVRGQEYEFEWPASGAEDPVIGINDADLLTSLGDLSPLMVELIDVSGAPHLTHVKVGDGAEGYANYSLNSITLGNNVLLRTLDCRNCPNLTMAPDISGCTNIEEIYFDGSAITGLKLPNGGILKTLHLPGTLKNLTLLNQTALTDFQMPSFTGVETLRLENNSAVIDPLAIFAQIPANSRVRIIGFETTYDSAAAIAAFYDRLDTMRGLDESGNNVDKAQVSGTIHIDTLTERDLHALQARYPTITIAYNSLMFEVYYTDWDGTLLYTATVNQGDNAIDPVTAGYINAPTRDGDEDIGYAYAGWGELPTNIQGSVTVVAQYVPAYAVRFYNFDGTLLHTQYVQNGGSATDPVANNSIEAPSRAPTEDTAYYYAGWDNLPTNVTGVCSVTATYTENYRVLFYGDGVVVNTQWIQSGLDAVDPVTAGYISAPTKAQTAQYTYTYSGWDVALTNVLAPRSINAVFSATVRTYTATFYNEDGTLLQTVANVPYGTTPSYTGSTPTKEGDYEFSGWSPALSGITGDTSYYAKFKYTGYHYVALVERSLSGEYENRDVTVIGENAFSYNYDLVSVKLWSVVEIESFAFSSCLKLERLVIYTNTLCELGGSALSSTAIDRGNGYIYVPKALVDSYKSASRWNSYSDQIRAIEDYPEVWDPYTWESVQYHIQQGDYASVYSIGDTVPLDLGSEGVVNMEIVAIDADDKADGSGKAPITWISKELLATSHRMNPARVANDNGTYQEGTGGVGGWEKCEMRTYLADTIKPLIPETVRSAIVPVTKYSKNYDTAGSAVNNVATTDDVWIPSVREIFGGITYETEGVIYSDKFTDAASRIKYKVGATSATGWWLRTAYSSTNFSRVGSGGSSNYIGANYSSGVALGFCT